MITIIILGSARFNEFKNSDVLDQAVAILKEEGIDVRVVDIHTIKPIDRDIIVKSAKETEKIITVEDHSIIGGLGSSICEVLSEECPTKVYRIGINDEFGQSGKWNELMEHYGITAEHIKEIVRK